MPTLRNPWEQMGQPETPTREPTEALQHAAWTTKKELLQAEGSGHLLLQRTIEACSLVLIRELQEELR